MAVGIKEVARHAGVSIASVSRVLSNQPYVSAAVRSRVLASVDELGYRPSRVARRLRRQNSKVLGLVISDIQNSFFTSLVRAVEDVAYQHQYAVFLCNSDEDIQKEQMYIDLLVAEGVAGVVISPTCETDLGCIRLVDSHIPLVTVDRRLLHVPSHRVLADNAGAAFELTAHLIKDGHTRIAGLFGLMSMTTGRERYEGYARALEAHGLPVDPALVRTGRPNEATGHAFTRELLALAVRPTAVLGGNNLLTMGALRAIRDTGLRIPADIGIASFDVVPWMPLVEPALTVVAMPTYEMGRVAAELLLQCIEGNPAPVREITLKARLQVGGSCYHHPALPGKAGREKEAVEPREGE